MKLEQATDEFLMYCIYKKITQKIRLLTGYARDLKTFSRLTESSCRSR
jgi:hypothetical protein